MQKANNKKAMTIQLHCNHINISIGYRYSDSDFCEIMGFDVIQPLVKIKGNRHNINLQIASHIIERMTLHKINFIDKVRIAIKSTAESGDTLIEANNLKVNIFPETIREIKRILSIAKSSTAPPRYRALLINKTMKFIKLIPITNSNSNQNTEIQH